MKWIVYICTLFLAACVTPPQENESASLHLQVANSLIEKDNYPAALKELLVAQDLDSNNPYIQSSLGYVYFIRERYDLSEEHYKRALQIKPDFSEAKNNLARIYIETSQNRQAEKLLAEVLVDYTYSDFPKAYLNMGLLDFNRKNYQRALVYFRKNLEKDRENCIAHTYVGRCYLELGNNSFAVEELNKAIRFCRPMQVDDAHYYSAIALFRNNQKDLAENRFEELLKVYPTGKNRENAKKMLDVLRKGNL